MNSPVVGMRTKTNAAITPGEAEGKRDAEEGPQPSGAQVLRGLEEPLSMFSRTT